MIQNYHRRSQRLHRYSKKNLVDGSTVIFFTGLADWSPEIFMIFSSTGLFSFYHIIDMVDLGVDI